MYPAGGALAGTLLGVLSGYGLSGVTSPDATYKGGTKRDLLGATCSFATKGVRIVAGQASLAIFSLIGAKDGASVDWALRPLHVVNGLGRVPRKRTNRNRVSLAPGGKRQIVRLRQQIQLGHDMKTADHERLRAIMARSRAFLIGNVSPELTQECLRFARWVGCYTALSVGEKQFSRVRDFKPHAMFLNLQEARQITHLPKAKPEQVFEKLLKMVAAEHVVVMSDGSNVARVANMVTGVKWELTPPGLERFARLVSVGCGDVLAGVSTFLLGMPETPPTGTLVAQAVDFAQGVVAAHMTGDRQLISQAKRDYAEILPCFQPAKRRLASLVPGACRDSSDR